MIDRHLQEFQKIVFRYYRQHGRHDLPWRQPGKDGVFDSHRILVSEIMLQQTQVPRVIPKFRSFIQRFPTYTALAGAPLSDVLKEWSGLGYNRRAKFLWQAAQQIVQEYGGVLPAHTADLITLPGIGKNTAGALLAYTYNVPVVFIETNVRTVFIHHFFADQEQVDDKEIADLVARTLPDDARTWYWSLMDYGTFIKQTVGNRSAASKHYKKQSPFAGSRRQVRGQVLRLLGDSPATLAQLQILTPDERLPEVLATLAQEGLIAKDGIRYMLYGS